MYKNKVRLPPAMGYTTEYKCRIQHPTTACYQNMVWRNAWYPYWNPLDNIIAGKLPAKVGPGGVPVPEVPEVPAATTATA